MSILFFTDYFKAFVKEYEADIKRVPSHDGRVFTDKHQDAFCQLVIDTIADFTFETNGHVHEIKDKTVKEAMKDFYYRDLIHWSLKDAFYFIVDVIGCNLAKGKDISDERYEKILTRNFKLDVIKCGECSRKIKLRIDFETKKLVPDERAAKIFGLDECPVKEPFAPCFAKIDVPSGVLVFANEMRDILGRDKCTHFESGFKQRSINCLTGKQERFTEYANEFNVIYAYVSNSSPHVYRKGKDLIVGHLDDDKADGNMGMITTDLWAYFAMDQAQFRELWGHNDVDNYIEVEVEPGQYHFSHFFYEEETPKGIYPNGLRTIIRKVQE